MSKPFWFLVVCASFIWLLGCSGAGEKGINKDKDRPKPAAKQN